STGAHGRQRNARLAFIKDVGNVRAGHAEPRRAPSDGELRASIAEVLVRLALHGRRDAGNLRDTCGDGLAARNPLVPLGGVVALDPALDGHEHADHFLPPGLYAARVAVIGRGVSPT